MARLTREMKNGVQKEIAMVGSLIRKNSGRTLLVNRSQAESIERLLLTSIENWQGTAGNLYLAPRCHFTIDCTRIVSILAFFTTNETISLLYVDHESVNLKEGSYTQ